MSKREVSVFSLSLLDLLFCAFGGVIVMTVVFSAIIKYEQAQTEESRRVAASLTLEYSDSSSVPAIWRLDVRKDPPNQDYSNPIEEPLRMFERTGYTFYSQLQPSSQGTYSVGFEGELAVFEPDSMVADTLYLSLYGDRSQNPFGQMPETLRSSSGQWLLSGFIFRPGQMPLPIEIPPIPGNQLYSTDGWIEIVFRYNDGILIVSTI